MRRALITFLILLTMTPITAFCQSGPDRSPDAAVQALKACVEREIAKLKPGKKDGADRVLRKCEKQLLDVLGHSPAATRQRFAEHIRRETQERIDHQNR